MRKIDLNHGAGKNRHVFVARIMLGLGIVSMIMLVVAVYYVNTRLVLLQAEADAFGQLQQDARKEPVQVMSKEEVVAVQAAMAELALAWEPLLVALEGIEAPEVRLLAVEPDSRQGKLRITAEASGTHEIIEYVEALDTQPMLQEVFLLRQERKEAGPFVFNIEAVWAAKS
jgi:hypothetical protein